jgi:hypothetical protein
MYGPAPTFLEYASPAATREPWGPLFFRPSRRSLLLLLLTAAAVTWLALRHDPWRVVALIPSDYHLAPLFTPDNQILAFDTRFGVKLYDPATGQLIRTVLSKIDTGTYRYFVVSGGRQILALPWTERTALLYDVQTGRVIDRFPNPDGLGSQLITVASDPLRIICYPSTPTRAARLRSSNRGAPLPPPITPLRMWHLGGRTPAAATQPIVLPRLGIGSSFSPDGRRILQGFAGTGFLLLDASARLVGWQEYPRPPNVRSPGGFIVCRFADANFFSVARTDFSTSQDVLEIRSNDTGELLHQITLAAGTYQKANWFLSGDAALLGVLNPGVPSAIPGTIKLEFHDTATNRVVGSNSCQSAWFVIFFPRSHRLLAPGADTAQLVVIDPAHDQPLALLPNSMTTSSAAAPVIAPDAQSIVTYNSSRDATLNLYRRAGLDCPESPLGALAFPQTWLTATTFIALILSLLRDARRTRRAASRPPSRLITAVLIAITLPLTLHALLTACLGRWTLTPAPLLLLVAVGLVTGARAWRWTALLLLAASLPLCLYLARRVQQANLRNSTRFELLDRFHDIPNVLPFIALLAASLLVVIALPLLARPRTATIG